MSNNGQKFRQQISSLTCAMVLLGESETNDDELMLRHDGDHLAIVTAGDHDGAGGGGSGDGMGGVGGVGLALAAVGVVDVAGRGNEPDEALGHDRSELSCQGVLP